MSLQRRVAAPPHPPPIPSPRALVQYDRETICSIHRENTRECEHECERELTHPGEGATSALQQLVTGTIRNENTSLALPYGTPEGLRGHPIGSQLYAELDFPVECTLPGCLTTPTIVRNFHYDCLLDKNICSIYGNSYKLLHDSL